MSPSAETVAPSLGSGAVTSADGTSIGFDSVGDGPPLLLVHGSSGSRHTWTPMLAGLTKTYRLYMLDRRGRGRSTDEAGPYSLQREAEDVIAVAEAVGGNVYVVAHSFGALTVMEAALQTSAFRRIVLYEPPMPARAAHAITPQALAAIKASTDPTFIMATFYEQTLHASPSTVSNLMRNELNAVAQSAALTISRELEVVESYRASPRLTGINLPVEMLLGTESPAYLQAATAMVASRIRGATIVALEGQGHQGIDGDPDQINRAVTGFDE